MRYRRGSAEDLVHAVAVAADQIPLGIRRDAVVGTGDETAQFDKGPEPFHLGVDGGAVVGEVPGGLPRLAIPAVPWSAAPQLLFAAVVISLLGFMEAVSIAQAMKRISSAGSPVLVSLRSAPTLSSLNVPSAVR